MSVITLHSIVEVLAAWATLLLLLQQVYKKERSFVYFIFWTETQISLKCYFYSSSSSKLSDVCLRYNCCLLNLPLPIGYNISLYNIDIIFSAKHSCTVVVYQGWCVISTLCPRIFLSLFLKKSQFSPLRFLVTGSFNVAITTLDSRQAPFSGLFCEEKQRPWVECSVIYSMIIDYDISLQRNIFRVL